MIVQINIKLGKMTQFDCISKAKEMGFDAIQFHDDDAVPNINNYTEEEIKSGKVASFTVEMTDGNLKTDIVNKAGVVLPETGGIGTTIFYIVGGLLAVAAVVLLVTKKRMAVK